MVGMNQHKMTPESTDRSNTFPIASQTLCLCSVFPPGITQSCCFPKGRTTATKAAGYHTDEDRIAPWQSLWPRQQPPRQPRQSGGPPAGATPGPCLRRSPSPPQASAWPGRPPPCSGCAAQVPKTPLTRCWPPTVHRWLACRKILRMNLLAALADPFQARKLCAHCMQFLVCPLAKSWWPCKYHTAQIPPDNVHPQPQKWHFLAGGLIDIWKFLGSLAVVRTEQLRTQTRPLRRQARARGGDPGASVGSAGGPAGRQLWPPSSWTGSACRRTPGRAGSGCCCWCSCTDHHRHALPPSPGGHETWSTGKALAHQTAGASHLMCIWVMGSQEITLHLNAGVIRATQSAHMGPAWSMGHLPMLGQVVQCVQVDLLCWWTSDVCTGLQ